MARSFKKNLVLKIAPTRKAAPKRQASHKVRHIDELASGGAYKRCFNSWDICDVRLRLEKLVRDRWTLPFCHQVQLHRLNDIAG